ncbi:MAG: OmpA family protein [Sandaracinaceae bacterium]
MSLVRLTITLAALGLLSACGAGSASAGASLNSDGTVSADANASVDTPAGNLSANADASGNASATATSGGYAATTTTRGTAVPAAQGGYVATTVPQGCVEQWVHMPLVINFPTGGTIIDAQNRAVLQEMVLSAQSRQDISAVRVEGHTDRCGNEANNMALSQQRAVTVANELVSMGVPRERLSTMGYGSVQPRANENCSRRNDDLSRNMNRRVEFSLLVCR